MFSASRRGGNLETLAAFAGAFAVWQRSRNGQLFRTQSSIFRRHERVLGGAKAITL